MGNQNIKATYYRRLYCKHEGIWKKQTIISKKLENLKVLTKNNDSLETNDLLSLIQTFSDTFFSLKSYDKNNFPKRGQILKIENEIYPNNFWTSILCDSFAKTYRLKLDSLFKLIIIILSCYRSVVNKSFGLMILR